MRINSVLRKITFTGVLLFGFAASSVWGGEFTYGPTREIFVDFSHCQSVNGSKTYHEDMGSLTWHTSPDVRFCQKAVLSQDMKASRFSKNNFGLVKGTTINLEKVYIGPSPWRKSVKNMWADDEMLGVALAKGVWNYRSEQSPYSENAKNYTPFSSVMGTGLPDDNSRALRSGFIVQGYLLEQKIDDTDLAAPEDKIYPGVLHIIPSYYQYLSAQGLNYSLSGYDYQYRKIKAEGKRIDTVPHRLLYFAKGDESLGSSEVFAFTIPKHDLLVSNVGVAAQTTRTLTPLLQTLGLASYLGMNMLVEQDMINGGVLTHKAIIANKKTMKSFFQGNAHKEYLLIDAIDSQWVYENKEILYAPAQSSSGTLDEDPEAQTAFEPTSIYKPLNNAAGKRDKLSKNSFSKIPNMQTQALTDIHPNVIKELLTKRRNLTLEEEEKIALFARDNCFHGGEIDELCEEIEAKFPILFDMGFEWMLMVFNRYEATFSDVFKLGQDYLGFFYIISWTKNGVKGFSLRANEELKRRFESTGSKLDARLNFLKRFEEDNKATEEEWKDFVYALANYYCVASRRALNVSKEKFLWLKDYCTVLGTALEVGHNIAEPGDELFTAVKRIMIELYDPIHAYRYYDDVIDLKKFEQDLTQWKNNKTQN